MLDAGTKDAFLQAICIHHDRVQAGKLDASRQPKQAWVTLQDDHLVVSPRFAINGVPQPREATAFTHPYRMSPLQECWPKSSNRSGCMSTTRLLDLWAPPPGYRLASVIATTYQLQADFIEEDLLPVALGLRQSPARGREFRIELEKTLQDAEITVYLHPDGYTPGLRRSPGST